MATIRSTLKLDDQMSNVFKNVQNAAAKAENTFGKVSNKIDSINNSSKKATSSTTSLFKGMLLANLASSAISKLANLITGQLSNAIKRFDTLNNYVNVMHNLGIGEKEAAASRERLAEGLKGIPTTLDSAVLAVQRFTASNSNVEASTEMFLALNNALLAGGASMDLQTSAMEQWAQAYSKGKPDMMEWRALLQAMPGQLKQIAKAMNTTTTKLGDDLRTGKISMNDFMKTAVELNQKGIDGFDSFEKQARNSTAGIGTALANMRSAISRGWTKMFEGANNALESSGLPTISQIITNLGNSIEETMTRIGQDAMPTLAQSIQDVTQSFSMFGAAIDTVGIKSQETTSTTLSLWDYFLLGTQVLALGVQGAFSLIQMAFLYAVLGASTFVAGTMSAFYMLQNGVEGVMVAILYAIQVKVNQAIDLVNGLINAFNTAFAAFGAGVEQISKAEFANKAAEGLQNRAQQRNTKIDNMATNIQNYADQVNSVKSQIGKTLDKGATNVQNSLANRQLKAAGGGGGTKSIKGTSYNPKNIDKLMNGVIGDGNSGKGSGGKAVKTTSTDKNLLSDEDIKLLLDVATRDYKLNYQQITPNVSVTFGDVRETADVDNILDQVANKLEEIYDGNLEVG